MLGAAAPRREAESGCEPAPLARQKNQAMIPDLAGACLARSDVDAGFFGKPPEAPTERIEHRPVEAAGTVNST